MIDLAAMIHSKVKFQFEGQTFHGEVAGYYLNDSPMLIIRRVDFLYTSSIEDVELC